MGMTRTEFTTTPQWIKITKQYSDFSTAATSNNITIYTLPAKGVIHAVQIIPTTAFSGGAISAYTISVGITGTLDKYSAAKDVFTGFTLPTIVTNAGIESSGSTTDIKAEATSTTANLSAATEGSVDIYLLITVLN